MIHVTERCEVCGDVREDGHRTCPSCDGTAPVEGDAGDGTDRVESFVWACPECGREHVKNSPPCSRCGTPTLERRAAADVDVAEVAPSTSWLSVVRPYAPVIVLFAVVIGLAASGVVTPEMLPGHGPPSLPEAPGDADVSAGLDLGEVEREVHDRLEAEREARAESSRSYDAGLATLAAHLNRDRVRVDRGLESAGDPDVGAFELPCSRSIEVRPLTVAADRTIDTFDDESAVAEAIATHLRLDPAVERTVFSSGTAEALDVHVDPDDVVHVYYASC